MILECSPVENRRESKETPLAQRIIESLGELKRLVGQEVAVSDYMQMTQERIDRFLVSAYLEAWSER